VSQKKSLLTVGACLVLAVLMFGLSTSAIALQQNGLTITQDTLQGSFVDTATSATSNKPSKPSKPSGTSKPTSPSSPSGASGSSSGTTYAVSKEDAYQLAKANLNADDTWVLNYEQLSTDNNINQYIIVMTDPVGDAHLRLVDANTGAVTIQSLWDFFAGNEYITTESYTNDSQTEPSVTQDQQEYENDDNDENEGDRDARLSFSWLSARHDSYDIAVSNLIF